MMSCLVVTVRVKSFCIAENVQKTFLKCLNTYRNIHAVEKDDFKTPLKAYEPSYFESLAYSVWESKNYFKPTKSEIESFLVLLPPPNVTGTLHLGHALTCTVQDVILRWKRMKGESVLWIPGIDHAGIATQAAVERHLKQTLNLSKQNLGREEFVNRIWKWKNEKSSKIIEQLRKMGASLDWNRLIYTLDSTHSKLVTDSFIQLYKDGLIYRKESLVNWCCSLQSSMSDIEVNWLEIMNETNFNVPGYDKPVQLGVIYKFAYKICNDDNEIVVSTTRPETVLGDVAVAIHPSHPDVSNLNGKYVWHPFRKEKIPIIVDDFVNLNLGTGAVKITPAHSLVDFNIGLKHKLKSISVINQEGLINKIGPEEKFHGLKRFDARWAVIKELKNLNLFRGSDSHSMSVPICSRSGDIIELILKDQWFLNCESISKKARDVVEKGELKMEPESYKNVWNDWLKTKPLRDWNLSRQLWWGHQIPMYECQHKEKTIWLPGTSLEEAKSEAAESFGAPVDDIKVTRDPDVLDTWFSSGLLPLSAMINQDRKPPISLIVTGHDILFFWIARMVMLSLQLKGEVPFENVLLHALIRDDSGKKMSKSLGNVIHPEDIINGISASDMENRLNKSLQEGQISKENFKLALASQKAKFPKGIPECGVDALRFTFCASYTQSDFINFDMEECISNRHFCNKILQGMNYFRKIAGAYREKRSEFDLEDIKAEKEKLNWFDNWILSKLAGLVETVEKSLHSYKFNMAADAIRNFMIKDFCNFYLASTKPILENASPLQFRTTISVFFHCQETCLRLLSPFMPFVTEGLYNAMPLLNGFNKCESVTVAKYPEVDNWREFQDEDLESRFEKILHLLTCLRRTKNWLNLKKESRNAYIKCPDELAELLFGEFEYAFRKIGGIRSFTRVDSLERENVIQQKIGEDLTVLIEHEMNKATLQNLFGPAISKEEDVNATLENLQKTITTPEWETMSSTSRRIHNRKIENLNLELEKIRDLKLALEKCRS